MSRRDKLKHEFYISRCFHGQPTLERETARNKWCLAHTHFAIFGKLVLLQVYNAQVDNRRLKKMNLKWLKAMSSFNNVKAKPILDGHYLAFILRVVLIRMWQLYFTTQLSKISSYQFKGSDSIKGNSQQLQIADQRPIWSDLSVWEAQRLASVFK